MLNSINHLFTPAYVLSAIMAVSVLVAVGVMIQQARILINHLRNRRKRAEVKRQLDEVESRLNEMTLQDLLSSLTSRDEASHADQHVHN